MDEMSVDIQQNRPIQLLIDDMSLQNLVIQGLRGALCDRHRDKRGRAEDVVSRAAESYA